ncbi:hypothetical protein [Actinocatenispora sera]|uniref:hypothetical protein n=1 Tax=Actinocatenispora sera TaxID=390989 RepID=UPI0004C36E95|nr:hypothetical protein [Actinocatenispora sera]
MPPAEPVLDPLQVEAAADVRHGEAAADVPDAETAADVPDAETAADVPDAETAAGAPAVETAAGAPAVESEHDLPHVEPEDDVPYVEPEDDVPGDDVPGDDVPGDDVPGDDAPGDDAPAAVPGGARLRSARRRTIAWYAVAGVIIVLLVGALVWPGAPDPAERQVRAFLAAIQRGDVAAAGALAADEPDPSADDSFLRASAPRQRWRITSVRAVPGATGAGETAVDATISTAAARTASYRFTVVRSGAGGWRLRDPYVYLSFGTFPLPYVDVDGHRKALPETAARVARAGTLVLFPGVHRFFASAPDTVTVPRAGYPLMPGTYVLRQPDAPGPDGTPVTLPRTTLTARAQRQAQREVDAYLDACARHRALVTAGCPFGARSVPVPGHPGQVFRGAEVTSVAWAVVRHPVVAVQPDGNEFSVADRRPGLVRLTVTGTDRQTGVHATTTLTCPTRDGALRVEVTDSGGLRIYPEGGRHPGDDLDDQDFRWPTC